MRYSRRFFASIRWWTPEVCYSVPTIDCYVGGATYIP